MSASTPTGSPKRTYADVATPPASPRESDMSRLSLNEKGNSTTETESFPPLPSVPDKISPLGTFIYNLNISKNLDGQVKNNRHLIRRSYKENI